MLTRTDLLADVMIALGYCEDPFDVDAILDDVIAEHGRVRLADLDPGTLATITARHTH